MTYTRITFDNGAWIIHEAGKNPLKPKKACTFAFDTETFVYLDGKIASQDTIFATLNGKTENEKRSRISTRVWSWQIYDEANGFFMTNDFDEFLKYQCRCRYKFGWCYNAKFDFSQIDYKILGEPSHPWKRHVSREGTAYNRGQPWAFESRHNDMGARYAYKLWIPYRNENRHTYTHAVEYRDFMNIFAGGLAKMLESLDVRDNEGNPIRKTSMEYQAVDELNLSSEDINYCVIDVKGLYFGIKKYNEAIEEQSEGEAHIFGEETNVCTAGGFAKREILRSLYPNKAPKFRIKEYQRKHPMSVEQDVFFRKNHLYRGGICFVNPKFRGKLLTAEKMGRKMNRYDVNSEYSFSMASIRDLVGEPTIISYREWLARSPTDREEYEAILMIKSAFGVVKKGYMGIWYDPFKKDYVETIDEDELHLMFEREFIELSKWYTNGDGEDGIDIVCEKVILYKRGDYAYKAFVDKYYELKASAKLEGIRALELVAKLVLNSGYGKLAERVERINGHYELNEETKVIHFVSDGKEVDAKSIMSVAVGALVTTVARIWILSHIREICGEANMENVFVYIDTDSIHAFADYEHADAYKLGGFKLEAECEVVKYIAPKTYFDVEEIKDGKVIVEIIDGKPTLKKIEMHSKGINIKAVKGDLLSSPMTIDYLDKRFSYGEKFVVLCAMNVKGGKALVPTEKYLADWAQAKGSLEVVDNYSGTTIISEV